jgi:ribonuclease G
MVQVAKEPLGNKGARLTTHITLPGRNLVFMPTIDHVGISRRIEDEDERARLRNLLEEMRPPGKGFIARTVSEGFGPDKLEAEIEFLCSLWDSVNQRRQRAGAPEILHQDLSVSLRAVRDLFTRDVDRLVIDCASEYQDVVDFVSESMPRLLDSVELYTDAKPIFDAYGVEEELNRALERKIWLKSGGYVVIEKTEALTSIDVNTGRYVGGYNLEETILKTNLEAVKEIAYQIQAQGRGRADCDRLYRHGARGQPGAGGGRTEGGASRGPLQDQRAGYERLGFGGDDQKAHPRILGRDREGAVVITAGAGDSSKIPPRFAMSFSAIWSANTRAATTARWRCGSIRRVAEVLLQEERYPLEEIEDLLQLVIYVTADPDLHAEQFELRPRI